MAELIKVGMADYKIGRNPASLISYGLGSCVGIALFDTVAKVGGLAHIMLPDSTQARATDNPAKFADTALPLMLSEIIKLGAVKSRITAKIAGGAQMFTFTNTTDIMRVGERNAEAVRLVLKKLEIRLIAEDTGGNYGRTVELKLDTGVFRVKTIDKGEKEL
ncbi:MULTISPECIES: chemotaxis protein CheD [Sporomusa]|jgi:chemotaxis protein CheD|uniref:Probable chemoreceptor glutamine deamidase CheD n=2 Tax=Sporomusa TaxID=2375 RepID=A0ABM9W0Y4_9FIRM|nr:MULTISPECIES: chemotaxis protein CheD [Sporomusa]MCM0760169.1 chemotaxis protein CheD [Sporomusa sphaeroides DSM 2875]OLS58182.1 chemoreceptor glutamine deamidase CheD [Sporomusa sphaeroides DSM 2875]CVK17631.1 Chemoreceptor glutamine deamidase CheD [Sporomusa sphaeroides DSM 2875]SCM80438.1 putative chemoreceptor glutamine deamidase CheD [uncultured Sporomusa sp.]HML31515.1 chemotaxis protein CheD [Sporomusa sphaeroides]